jgi:hypothetical protein
MPFNKAVASNSFCMAVALTTMGRALSRIEVSLPVW